ncbi:acylphosphatase [Geomonas sp. RF6]|uniref:acylphosphatase n=1 Tax=Geomonas sp. RF6 TaxID=2897342 RepID=UPI001E443727|nr:acylphosphatase [Geomonas sp. RF6]UFS71408.1 acylphosphatase [Geomonas sp. RF6]
MKLRVMVTIRGRVQGVGFRYQCAEEAALHNVSGWVKNLPDDSVRGCFEGEEEDVLDLVQWCRKGPRGAWVEELKVEEREYTGEFSGFSIRHGGE